jgi:sugar phosphate isomerase/epimerase
MADLGFSTGAVAYGDFQKALQLLEPFRFSAVELSALREPELATLVEAAEDLNLSGYRYISFHAPSSIEESSERVVLDLLRRIAQRNWPIIVHPNIIHSYEAWRQLGRLLLIENMDKRKPIARTADELAVWFERLPEAGLCFDVGHAKQIDATMNEAVLILSRYRDRLRQVHVSEVSTDSKHKSLTHASELAYGRIAGLIPDSVPIICESTGVDPAKFTDELAFARRILFEQVPVYAAD